MPDAKDTAITVGAAIAVAGRLAAAAAQQGRDPVEYFGSVVDAVVEKAIELQAQYAVSDAFPGTTVVAGYTPPTAQVAPQTAAVAYTPPAAPTQGNQPAPAPAPQAAPAPIPGASDGDPQVAALWTEFFANPNAWYNNMTSKRSPKAPDFKHKTQGTPETGNKALWANDKKNPSWVAQGLRQIGLTA